MSLICLDEWYEDEDEHGGHSCGDEDGDGDGQKSISLSSSTALREAIFPEETEKL